MQVHVSEGVPKIFSLTIVGFSQEGIEQFFVDFELLDFCTVFIDFGFAVESCYDEVAGGRDHVNVFIETVIDKYRQTQLPYFVALILHIQQITKLLKTLTDILLLLVNRAYQVECYGQ